MASALSTLFLFIMTGGKINLNMDGNRSRLQKKPLKQELNKPTHRDLSMDYTIRLPDCNW